VTIKVLHVVSGSVNDGASKGALYLHKYLLKFGVNSKILFNLTHEQKETKIDNIFYYKKSYYEIFIYYLYKLLFKIIYNLIFFKSYKYIFTTGIYGINLKKNKLFEEADIIQLHSVDDFISLSMIRNIHKPIVWTLRDWWTITGGCHIPDLFNCKKYQLNCHKCDQLKSKVKYDISYFLHKIKKKFIISQNNINFVAISDKVKNDFQSTYNNVKINRIYNLTDQENFYPDNSQDLKVSLNISTAKRIILFGAARISDPYKGFQYLELIISKLDPKLYFIISFGVNDKINLSKFNFDHINFGEVNDINKLRKIYSVSDLFLCTSIFESFGKTVLESLLCSTPVVAFDVGAVNEIIVHRKNGYLAKPFDIDDFIIGINYIFNKKKEWKSNAQIQDRLKYLEPFSHKTVSKQYLDLYKKIIKDKNIS
jgi:glycosyltransferase involved in cell wall biosynthesis